MLMVDLSKRLLNLVLMYSGKMIILFITVMNQTTNVIDMMMIRQTG
jgi:hypothetical protein